MTVAEEGQFQLAAARLAISRLAVSKRLATLEADLGVRLLNRSARLSGVSARRAAVPVKVGFVSFAVPADAYDRFMGRFSEPLAGQFAAWLGLVPGQRVLDVGCGPGALTRVLAAVVGPGQVSAIDPSDSFVAAVRERVPGVDVRPGVAEKLPWPDGAFDCTAAQLAVHLMADPQAGIAEMARVTRPGGVVAATVWDLAGGTSPVSVFWRGAQEIDPAVRTEADRPGGREGDLPARLRQAGLVEVESTVLTVSLRFSSFEEWWAPFTLGVGPPGSYLAGLTGPQREALRDACARLFPAVPVTLSARSWTARGRTARR